MDRFGLTGQTALVTGAGRGIGAATAELFASAGARVAVLDIDKAAAAEVAARIEGRGSTAVAITCDVTDEKQVESAFASAAGTLGGLDVLVNNAGGTVRKPSTELSLAEWRKVLDLNLMAVFLCSRVAARQMIKRGGGAIVNLASIMGFSGGLYPNAPYQASKGGVVNLTRALALEWAEHKIRVNAVAPTFVRTDLTAPLFANQDMVNVVMQHTPLGALPEVDDIAAAILFLASPAARCITGVTLPVDSGYLAR